MEPTALDALVDSTKRFALLAETLERNASETVQQQKQSTLALQQSVAEANQQIQSVVDRAGRQLEQLLAQAIDKALAPGTQHFEKTAQALAGNLQQAADSARKQQEDMAAKLKYLLWKLNAVAIASVFILLLGGIALIHFQHQVYRDARDRAKAAEVEAKIAEAMKQAQVTSCGGRPCLKLDLKAQRWGSKGEYVLLQAPREDERPAGKR